MGTKTTALRALAFLGLASLSVAVWAVLESRDKASVLVGKSVHLLTAPAQAAAPLRSQPFAEPRTEIVVDDQAHTIQFFIDGVAVLKVSSAGLDVLGAVRTFDPKEGLDAKAGAQ